MVEHVITSLLQQSDLHKFHALGNDFIVSFRDGDDPDAPAQARRLCDRRTGIGADGVITVIDDPESPRFVLHNADGSRPEVSGNGLRCFAHAVAGRRGLDETNLHVTTDTATIEIAIRQALSPNATAAVDMGAATPGPDFAELDIGSVLAHTRANTVSIGNPHLVVEVDDLDGLDIAAIGPALESHFLPTGINVHLVQATPSGIQMLIWERGAGVTQACGSGACAASVVAAQSRPDMDRWRVEMPGGVTTVEVGETATLHGPSTYVAAIGLVD